MHSAQREIRERHHYSVDCIVAIYVGILLWKMTGFIWPMKNKSRDRKLDKLEKIQSRLMQAAKDSDMEEVRELLKEVELGGQEKQNSSNSKAMWLFSAATIFSTSPLFSLHLHGRLMVDLIFWYEFFGFFFHNLTSLSVVASCNL